MPAISSSAPGKCILLGEHSVVYHRPAIAIPVTQVRAHTVITPRPTAAPGEIRIQAPDIDMEADLDDLPSDHPLLRAVQVVLNELHPVQVPAFLLRITSTIPVAAGLGSSAAVSVSIIRAVSTFLGQPLPDEKVSDLAYQVEKLQHGNPSGVDNTVVSYAQPVVFQRGMPFEHLIIAQPFTLVIADSGKSSPTAQVVEDVRRQWEKSPSQYERIFDEIAALVNRAKTVLVRGPLLELGGLLSRNHEWLQQIKVSCPELDQLVSTALASGALGAKLSGGGRGGNVIALVIPQNAEDIAEALRSAGAVRTIITTVGSNR